MIRGCQVHTSRRLGQRREKEERSPAHGKEERNSPGSDPSCTGSSCEVLFSIRCIILKTHLTFQAELVWDSHIARGEKKKRRGGEREKIKKSPGRARWLAVMCTCCVELKRFACLCRRNVWVIWKRGHFLRSATDTFNWGCQQRRSFSPTCSLSHKTILYLHKQPERLFFSRAVLWGRV